MSKPKMANGILARDKDDTCPEGSIIFYPCEQIPIHLENGYWEWNDFQDDQERHWTVKRWNEEYGLKPPANGKCFEVEIAL